MQPDEPKLCPKCGALKMRSHFGTDKARRDGLKHSCKACCNAARREWAARNPDRMKHYRSQDKSRHPETIREGKRRYKRRNAEKINEYRRAHHAEHPEKDNRRKAEWRQSNPQKNRAQKKAWAARNPEKQKVGKSRRFERSKARPSYAKQIIRQLTGIAAEHVPLPVAEAKAAQLLVTRTVRKMRKSSRPNLSGEAWSAVDCEHP